MTEQVAGTHARVLVLGGPSGSGKSRWAAQLCRAHGWPMVRLDDFYKEAGDETLPMSPLGIADWDDVRSWNLEAAVEALQALCRVGEVEVPRYDISASRVVGTDRVTRGDARVVVAEGIFAPHVIAPLRERGLLMGAYCLHQGRWVTFARRLVRDLAEHRKSPPVLVRRGLRLAQAEPGIIAEQQRLGAEPIRPKELARRLAGVN